MKNDTVNAVNPPASEPAKIQTSALEPQNPVVPKVSAKFVPDYALLAKMHVREGKTFRESALAAGYSESVASRGLRALTADSQPVADAIRREENSLSVNMDRLKPLAVNRLYHEILNPVSHNGMKAIELAGRFKETDWFVRNTDTNLGVFLSLGESAPLEQPETYKE